MEDEPASQILNMRSGPVETWGSGIKCLGDRVRERFSISYIYVQSVSVIPHVFELAIIIIEICIICIVSEGSSWLTSELLLMLTDLIQASWFHHFMEYYVHV